MKHAILLLVSIITLSACRTHQHAESINHTAESTRIIRDTVNLIAHQRDTIIMRDSIAHSEKVVGDTVRIAEGPLKGIVGRVVKNDKKSVLVIDVEVFGNAVAVELSPQDCVVEQSVLAEL